MSAQKPNIFDYRDYRLFLTDYERYNREESEHFSTRWFAKKAGFGSHCYFRMVVTGKRNFSLKATKKVAKALGLTQREKDYFSVLTLYNQATLDKDKEHYFQKLIQLKPAKKVFKLERDKYSYFTNKFMVIIREMVALPHFQEDSEWISAALNRDISVVDVKKCIEALLRLDLLKRNKDGILVQSHGTVESPIDSDSLEVLSAHRSIINHVKEVMITVPKQEREIISITLPVEMIHLPALKEILRKCRDEVVKFVNEQEPNFEEVYQVNLQMVPVSQTRKVKI